MPRLVGGGWGRFWHVELVKIKDLSAFYSHGFLYVLMSSFVFLCCYMLWDVVSLFLRIVGGLMRGLIALQNHKFKVSFVFLALDQI